LAKENAQRLKTMDASNFQKKSTGIETHPEGVIPNRIGAYKLAECAVQKFQHMLLPRAVIDVL
jgi:hypothetical protein